jgi:hypothetical protein
VKYVNFQVGICLFFVSLSTKNPHIDKNDANNKYWLAGESFHNPSSKNDSREHGWY